MYSFPYPPLDLFVWYVLHVFLYVVPTLIFAIFVYRLTVGLFSGLMNRKIRRVVGRSI